MSQMSLARRRQIISQLVRTPAGRHQLAASLQEPLREYRDYEAVGRRAFMIDQLPDGTLPYYDKDVDTPAYVVGEEGEDVLVVVKGERIYIPMFEIATNPMISITQMKERKFDLESRVKTKTKAEVFRKEDEKVFALFQTVVEAGSAPNPPIEVDVPGTSVTIDHFSNAMALIEAHGHIRCANIFMNPANMKVLRAVGKDYFEPAYTQELLRTGFVGTIFGCQIHTTPALSSDWIFFTGEPEFFGVIPVRQDLTVLSADNPARRQIGFSIWEQLGMAIHNPKALAAIHLI